MVMTSKEPYVGPLRKVATCLMKGESKRIKQLHQIYHNGYEHPLIGFGTWKIPN